MRLRARLIAGLRQRRRLGQRRDAAGRQNRRAARAQFVKGAGDHRTPGTVGDNLQPGRRGCAAAGQIQLAALRITLQRIDNGEGQAFKHRALQFGAGGVRANAEKAGPRVRAVKRRTFAIEVRLPEDAAAAWLHLRDRLLQPIQIGVQRNMLLQPVNVWRTGLHRKQRDHLPGFGMGDKARRLVHRLRAAADDPGAAGSAEDRVDIPFVDRAAAQRGATDIQRPGGHRRRGGQPGQRRHRIAQRAGRSIRGQQRGKQRQQFVQPHLVHHHRGPAAGLLIE